MTITEFVQFRLKEGVTAETLATDETYKKVINIVTSQPGLQKLYHSPALEDPTILFWFLEWDVYESHETFMNNKEVYGPFGQDLVTLLDMENPKGAIQMAHYPLSPPVSSLITTEKPTLEVLVVNSKESVSHEEKDEKYGNFVNILKAGGTQLAYAVAKEDARKVLVLIAWASMEQHEQFKAAAGPKFGELVGPVLAISETPTVLHTTPVEWK